MTLPSNQRPQQQDLTPHGDHNIRPRDRDRASGREARERTGEDGRGAKKRKKPHKSYRRHVENEGGLGGRRVLV